MFGIRDNVFSSKNAITKNTTKKTNYLPKAGKNIASTYSLWVKRKTSKINNVKNQ
jgi:hypothetical protein